MTTKIWPNKFKLDKKVIVVTGAGLIGSVVIKALADFGANVIIAEMDEGLGKEIENRLKKENQNISFIKTDITNEESINLLIKETSKKFGEIDGWVNTAYPKTADFGQDNIQSYDSFINNLNIHLGGYYNTSIKIAEIMKKQRKGSIINFSSIYGVVAPDFKIYEGTKLKMPISYAVIKGGINMLTKYLASYYGEYNVRANVIAPGGVFDNQAETFVMNYKKKIPLKRMALPEDVAGAVIFLMSEAASYITGQVIMIDGGWTSL